MEANPMTKQVLNFQKGGVCSRIKISHTINLYQARRDRHGPKTSVQTND
jgi:hypothetical protein